MLFRRQRVGGEGARLTVFIFQTLYHKKIKKKMTFLYYFWYNIING